ncbi:MAG: copper-binding protein [Burkholderiales bacterium]
MKTLTTTIVAAAAVLVGLAANAQSGQGHAAHAPAPAAKAPSAAMSEGEVRKVDRAAGKITLKHGPVPSIDMPPMTMVFVAADPAMLDRVKPGDKVRFAADKVGDVYRVTRIEPVK